MSKQIFGSVGGGLVGSLLGGPLGAIVGGGVGGSLFGGKDKGGAPSAPNVTAPQPPKAPSEQPDTTNFGAQPGAMELPTFLGINSSMSPLQQRSRLATLSTSGGFGGIARPSVGTYAGQGLGDVAQAFYKNIALRSLTDPSGNPVQGSEILPVEKQYMTSVLGQPLQRDTIEHFLTLLQRGSGG
jgi:hypothetical protein